MRACDPANLLSRLDTDELNRIDGKVREVIRAVEETGKQGEFTLKFTIKKNGENSSLMTVKDTYKAPQQAASSRVLYFKLDDMNNATGELSDLPPKQEPLFQSDNVRAIATAGKKG